MKNKSRFSLFLKDKKQRKAVLEYIGIIFLVIVLIISFRYAAVKGGFFTIDYETTEGLITKSEVLYKRGVKRGAHHYHILYRYSAEGTQLESGQINFGPTGYREKHKAQAMADKYPVGTKVKVYYERGNESFSVLEPQVNSNNDFIIIIVALLFPLLIIGCYMFKRKNSPKISAIKATKKRRK